MLFLFEIIWFVPVIYNIVLYLDLVSFLGAVLVLIVSISMVSHITAFNIFTLLYIWRHSGK